MSDQAPPLGSVARRTAAAAGWIMAWRMLNRSLGLVSTLILVRLLEPTDFGLVAIATGFVISVDALSALGVQDALVREKERTRDLYDTGFGLEVIRGAITAVLVALLALPLARFFSDSRLTVVMLVLAGGTLMTSFENIGTVDFRRNLQFHKEFHIQMVARLVATATTIVTAAIFHSYWALVVGILSGRAIRLVQSYTMSSYRPRFAVRAWRGIIGFSLWTWAFSLVVQARDRADSMVIGFLFGSTSVGLFSIGAELGSLPTTEVTEPLNRALFSGFVAGRHKGEGPAAMFLSATGLGLLVTLPAGLGISMVADPMVRLTLGERWIDAVPIIVIIGLASAVTVFSYVSGALLNAIGKPHLNFYLLAVSVAMRFPLLMLLLHHYGLPGGAAAVAISLAMDQVLFLWFTLPKIGVSARQLAKAIWRPVVGTAAMVLALMACGWAWTPVTASGSLGLIGEVTERCLIGASVYILTVAAAWLAAGRPDGPERHIVSVMKRTALKTLSRL